MDPHGRGTPHQRALKRIVDVTAAFVALVALLPLMLAIALAVVLESPGPVFYRADRVGFRGRRLRMLKFRKMRTDAAGPALTTGGDERLTRVGAVLARTRLDELPQLWHVLRGEMSLIGPRPEDPCFVGLFRADYDEILRVRPGIAGWTQLAFAEESQILRADDPLGHYVHELLPQKVALDRLYAANATLAGDARIMIATLAAVLLRRPIAVHRETGALTRRRRPQEADLRTVRHSHPSSPARGTRSPEVAGSAPVNAAIATSPPTVYAAVEAMAAPSPPMDGIRSRSRASVETNAAPTAPVVNRGLR
jgi:lipopolysaccharide/colanic/teichoic acid biosynthesis glycosyltransferase